MAKFRDSEDFLTEEEEDLLRDQKERSREDQAEWLLEKTYWERNC